MVFAIPNPQKNFQISYDMDTAKEAVKNVQLINTKYNLYKSDDILSIYTFDVSEFLSIGALIVITLTEISEHKTNLNIEVQRKIGSFNQSHEVNLANQHIFMLTELISESLQTDKSVMDSKRDEIEREANEKKREHEEFYKKLKELKENRPLLFYSQKVLVWTFVLAVFVLVVYVIYKLFTLT